MGSLSYRSEKLVTVISESANTLRQFHRRWLSAFLSIFFVLGMLSLGERGRSIGPPWFLAVSMDGSWVRMAFVFVLHRTAIRHIWLPSSEARTPRHG
ncbi:restriction modification system DNA specificity domain protein [Burkholderia pseudomallei A79D]|nr:restriction modification system DNA specificity domain protein [Burkholderia pseudomallei A79D]KGX96921.1 restriction modification system DNA specificity domain protein [Burkholderia pseudomallei A79C]